MHVAGPINTPDEARMLEQVAYLADLRMRLHAPRPRGTEPPEAKPPPASLFTY